MKRALTLAFLTLAWAWLGSISILVASATAQDSSPYVVGHWNLADSFQDFTGGSPLTTDNTDITFLNPTDLTLTLEYAFFAEDTTTSPSSTVFCGCDRDTLPPNGRTRYTMLAEMQGGQFSASSCKTSKGTELTEGELKSIVFLRERRDHSIVIGDAMQAGTQIHVFGSNRTESNLQGVSINRTTVREMNKIHAACVKFIGS
ncbi:MAG TPA: hypothetical protein VFA57_18555 [Pseudolabrys sp.]|nr:hypothetical protein [Pseudolabrys sp.]